jgi:uncharacterized membrane protein YheB (UPF0754 family)
MSARDASQTFVRAMSFATSQEDSTAQLIPQRRSNLSRLIGILVEQRLITKWSVRNRTDSAVGVD